MYYIIEKQDQLQRMEASQTAFIQLITVNHTYHPKLSRPSLLYYNNGEKGYIFCIEHCEGFQLEIKEVEKFLSKHEVIYLMDEKFHSYFLDLSNIVDLNNVSLDSENSIKEFDCDTQFHRQFYQQRINLVNVDALIPISKHYEKCECFYDQVKYLMGLEVSNRGDKLILDAYKYVEQHGIGVKEEHIVKLYDLQNSSIVIRNNVAYSNYNLYNITGRPTNSFGGINFLAIQKEGDFRKCFVPKNDYFVEFDFEGYHLKLIANLGSKSVPKSEPTHRVLASQYFKKPVEEITEEEYKQGKVITFRQLYGGVEEQYKDIEFFSSLKQFVDEEWKKYKAQHSYVLPTGRIVKYHSSMTKHKLFNYILQNYETKINVDKISELRTYLLGKKTELVLITYDAFLFDFSVEDGKDTLLAIKEILQAGGFPVNHKHGKDYSFTL
jgi:hypothetical protein